MEGEDSSIPSALAERYAFEGPLRPGGHKKAWVARRRQDGAVVVVVLAGASKGAVAESWLDSIAQVSHDRIARLIEHGRDGAAGFAVLEYGEGSELLSDRLARGLLPLHEAVTLALDVLHGLEVLYAAGLTHGRISAKRVIVTGGRARLWCDPADGPVATLEPHYAGPERWANSPFWADAPADVYAAGVLLFQLFAGRYPFEGPGTLELGRQHGRDPVPKLALFRPEAAPFDDAVRRALSKFPESRPSVTYLRAAVARAAGQRVPESVPGAAQRDADRDQSSLISDEPPLDGMGPSRTPTATAPPPPPIATAPSAPPTATVPSTQPTASSEHGITLAPPGDPHLKELASRLPPPGPGFLEPIRVLGRTLAAWLATFRSFGTPRDPVDCTVCAPPLAAPSDVVMVQVFVHTPAQTREARELAKTLDSSAEPRGFRSLEAQVRRGTRLDFHLVAPGIAVDRPRESLVWNGRPAAVNFFLPVPPDFSEAALIASVLVSQAGAPLGHVRFKIDVQVKRVGQVPPQAIGVDARAYRRADLL